MYVLFKLAFKEFDTFYLNDGRCITIDEKKIVLKIITSTTLLHAPK